MSSNVEPGRLVPVAQLIKLTFAASVAGVCSLNKFWNCRSNPTGDSDVLLSLTEFALTEGGLEKCSS